MIKTSSIYKIPADKYNDLLAETLKQIPEFKQPEWASFVKTGMAKKRPPQNPDFWFKRASSILRQIYVHETVGVNRLKTRYGSKKNRGYKPEKFKKASGKMIRVILQQAEAAGLLEKTTEGKRAGRKLTEKGIEFLENIKLSDKAIEVKPKITDKPMASQEQSDEVSEDINEVKDNGKQEAIKESSSKKPIINNKEVVEGK